MPQQTNSPANTPRVTSMYGSSLPYTAIMTGGTIRVFATIGGIGESHYHLLRRYVPTAPISVARLPNTTSLSAAPLMIFDIRHPIKSPGIAAGVKHGRTVSISEKRNCTAPLSSPRSAEKYVSTTYSAAIIAAWVINKSFLFFIFN